MNTRALVRAHPHLTAAVVAIALVLLGVLLVVPDADGETRTFPRARGAVALTFDDGPDPRFTPAVLDTLRAYDARATFFVVGEQAEKHPALVARMVAEGHEVAHHTYSHPHVDRLGRAELAEEIDRCLEALRAQGISPTWYRPPRAKLTDEQEELAAARGMRVALWARCFERQRFVSAAQMADTLAAETHSGDILLAHDGLADRSITVEALPRYLAAMRERRIKITTLSNLLVISAH